MLSNTIGHQRCARQLDHRANHVVNGHAILAHHLARDFVNKLGLLPQLFADGNQRHHNLELYLLAFTVDHTSGFKNRATLHSCYFRKQQSETAATKTQHRIGLANTSDLA